MRFFAYPLKSELTKWCFSHRDNRIPDFDQVCHPGPRRFYPPWTADVSFRAISRLDTVSDTHAMSVNSTVMYVNLYGNSTAFQTLAMLQGLRLVYRRPPFHR